MARSPSVWWLGNRGFTWSHFELDKQVAYGAVHLCQEPWQDIHRPMRSSADPRTMEVLGDRSRVHWGRTGGGSAALNFSMVDGGGNTSEAEACCCKIVETIHYSRGWMEDANRWSPSNPVWQVCPRIASLVGTQQASAFPSDFAMSEIPSQVISAIDLRAFSPLCQPKVME